MYINMHSLQHPAQPMQRLDMFSLRKHDWLESRQENKKKKKTWICLLLYYEGYFHNHNSYSIPRTSEGNTYISNEDRSIFTLFVVQLTGKMENTVRILKQRYRKCVLAYRCNSIHDCHLVWAHDQGSTSLCSLAFHRWNSLLLLLVF